MVARRTAVVLLVVLAALLAIQPVLAAACSGYWFESARTGRLELANFSQELQCRWGTVDDRDALQRSGECGMPTQKNDLIVLTHNWLCGWYDCPTGSIYPHEANIPLMQPGETALLCDGAELWAGRVIANIHVGKDDRALKPQTEFSCAGEKCGAIVTSMGVRYWNWGPADYAVVRLSYVRAR